MVSRSKLSSGFNQSDTKIIQLKDLGDMLALIIQDAGQIDLESPKNISNALAETISLLEDGFKHETDKGQLYYALHHSLNNLKSAVSAVANDNAGNVKIKTHDLELFKTSYVQLGEAALQYGGHEEINKLHPELRQYFSNNAEGHGPDDKKYKAALLRDIVRNTAPKFVESYSIKDVSDDVLEFYDAPAPAQRLN